MKKSKIVFQALRHFADQYKVIKLVNRTMPDIGAKLTRKEVNLLLTEKPDVTVEIVPEK